MKQDQNSICETKSLDKDLRLLGNFDVKFLAVKGIHSKWQSYNYPFQRWVKKICFHSKYNFEWNVP